MFNVMKKHLDLDDNGKTKFLVMKELFDLTTPALLANSGNSVTSDNLDQSQEKDQT